MAYSQNNEEEIILKHLDRFGIKSGRFLEIGAWDGKGFSNTFRLSELGWKGVLVEPSPLVFPKLIETYHGKEGMEFVNAAIGPIKSSFVPWYDSGGDAISTTSEAHKIKWETGWKVKFTRFWVYVMPMQILFDTFGYNFDMINIDVEGTNIELFRALPWKHLSQLRILCIEHDNYVQEMSQIAAIHGFQSLGVNGENLILGR